jgi:hypothetical protein
MFLDTIPPWVMQLLTSAIQCCHQQWTVKFTVRTWNRARAARVAGERRPSDCGVRTVACCRVAAWPR